MYDPAVPCKKCGNRVPASSLKLDLDLRMMVCPDCIKGKHVHKEIEKEAFHKPEAKVHEAVPEPQKEAPAKIGHKCSSCGYKFMINVETKSPKSCPYCNTRITTY